MRPEDRHGPAPTARPAALGSARLEGPRVVPADSLTTVTLVYTAGSLGVDDGGRIMVALRTVEDFLPLQVDDPAAPGYCTATSPADVTLTPRYDALGGFRPFWKAVTVLVTEGSLAPGDEVRVTFGDTSGGSPGWRVQTFAETRCVFLVAADPVRTGTWEVLPERPAIRITNGPAARLVAVLPTETAVGRPFSLFVRIEDAWGNVAHDYTGEVRVASDGAVGNLPETVRIAAGGCVEVAGLTAAETGVVRVTATAAGLEPATSNPLVVRPRPADLTPFWGDLHAQSGETIGVGTVREYFAFARDCARVDFASHQGNCFQVSDEKWALIQTAAGEADDPGRFAAFPGYEWSANVPLGGDHNVVFLEEGQPIRRAHRWLTGDVPRDEGANRADQLYAALDPEKAIVSHHVGGRPGNLDFFPGPDLESFIEVHSCWGTFEWFWRDALERGLKVGFICGSDDHKGRPGAAHPGRGAFGCRGGLVCASARRLDRPGLWEAFKARRVYGTTGARIGVWFSLHGEPMGSEVAVTGPPTFDVEVAGTAAIECIELWRARVRPETHADNADWRGEAALVERFTPWDPTPEPDDVLRVAWGGSRRRGRRRATVWDGGLTVAGAAIVDAMPYGFVPPVQRVSREGNRVTWQSTTTGGRHGVVVTLDRWAGDLALDTPPYKGRWSLDAVTREPTRIEVGRVDLHVELARLPRRPDVTHVARRMTAPAPPAGEHAYCLRIRQTDGERAWTSPIFVSPPECVATVAPNPDLAG